MRHRESAWKADIDLVRDTLFSQHPLFSLDEKTSRLNDFRIYARSTKAEIDKQLSALKEEILGKSDVELLVKLSEIVALISGNQLVGDGHTAIIFPHHMCASFPVQFKWFESGYYMHVIRDGEYPESSALKELLGSQLKAINGIELPILAKKMKLLTNYDNSIHNCLNTADRIRQPLWLYGLDIISSLDEKPFFTLVNSNGGESTIQLSSLDQAGDGLDIATLDPPSFSGYILARSANNALYNHWVEPYTIDYLECYDILHIRVYSFHIDDTLFNQRMYPELKTALSECEKRGYTTKVVIDVRNNLGGYNGVPEMLSGVFIPHMRGFGAGSLYMLINEGTYSAGITAIKRFKADYDIIIVGSQTAGRVQFFGCTNWCHLPYTDSYLKVSQCAVFDCELDAKNMAEHKSSIIPDITIPYLPSDYLAAKDPQFEWILTQKIGGRNA